MSEQHVSEHGELANLLEGLDSLFEQTARDALTLTLERVLDHMVREERWILDDPLLRGLGVESTQVSG